MSEESNSTENNDTKNPMSVFVKLTVVSLVFTASVMFLFYNFAKFKNVDVGSLGGAFQGTFGVAAAVAGAIVTIQLAKIAIDQAKKSNDIAARQARNDDPNYIIARETKAALSKLSAGHSIIENVYREMKVMNIAEIKIPSVAGDFISDALTSDAIIHMLAICSDTEDNGKKFLKYQATRDVGRLLGGLDYLFSNEQKVSKWDILNHYYLNASRLMLRLNETISGLDNHIKPPAENDSSDNWYQHYLSGMVSSNDQIPIEYISDTNRSYSSKDYTLKLKENIMQFVNDEADKENNNNIFNITTIASDISTRITINEIIGECLGENVEQINYYNIDSTDFRSLDSPEKCYVISSSAHENGKLNFIDLLKNFEILNTQQKLIIVLDGLRGESIDKAYDEMQKNYDVMRPAFISEIKAHPEFNNEKYFNFTKRINGNLEPSFNVLREARKIGLHYPENVIDPIHPSQCTLNGLYNFLLSPNKETDNFATNNFIFIIAIDYDRTSIELGYSGFTSGPVTDEKATWLASMFRKEGWKYLGSDAKKES